MDAVMKSTWQARNNLVREEIIQPIGNLGRGKSFWE